jgi:hypothetical protein
MTLLFSTDTYQVGLLKYPNFSYLRGEIKQNWRLIQPLLVEIEQDDDDSYIISDTQFGVYGHGATVFEAQQDYIVSLIDYYQLLSERANTGLPTRLQFYSLQLYLQSGQPEIFPDTERDRNHLNIESITEQNVSESRYNFYVPQTQ